MFACIAIALSDQVVLIISVLYYLGQSLWPVMLSITSLPPSIRMNFRYLLLAGIWLGNVKPDVSIILQPVLDKVHDLYVNGIAITTPDGPKLLRAKLLTSIFDLPAKAMCLNCIQWNGNYGCCYCYDAGTQVSHRRLYLPDDEHHSRSEKEVLKHAHKALKKKHPVYGIKGNSILAPYINIVKDVPIDYMHAVLEGVGRTLIMKFWMNGSYRNFCFYLMREVKDIDKSLLAIKPPHEFRRSPRSIETSIKYWKASEFRAFLLYYAIPLLIEFLPMDYIHHLYLLVRSLHILLGTKISFNDINKAEEMLAIFYNAIPFLYPDELCTMNVHSLIHLCDCARRCGPLWSFSCFGFESMNGHLKKHCHGTRNVLPQLVRNVRFHQTYSDQHQRKSDTCVLGRIKNELLQPEYITAIKKANFSVSTPIVPVFSRYKLNGTVYQVYNSSRSRNSSVCKFKRMNGTTAFGSITCFCLCDSTPIALLATFQSPKDVFDGLCPASIELLNSHSCNISCIFKVAKLSPPVSNFEAVLISSILVKCVHIPSLTCDYVIPMPNPYEHH